MSYIEWKAIAEGYQKQFEDCAEDRSRLTEENERLKLDVEVCGAELSRYTENIVQMAKQDRINTVREMQKEINKTLSALCKGDVTEIHRIVDQIAKEILEGE